jgi:6-phosphogluconolactonase (cycloisomerase 2 family)
VGAYTRHADGTLGRIAELPSGGSAPCQLVVDPHGSWLAVANYGDGTLGMYRLDEFGRFLSQVKPFGNTGSGPVADRQEGPHAHQATFGPDGTLYVTDLGTDEIRRYSVGDEIQPDQRGPVPIASGTGPRHLAHAGGRWYLAGELDGSVSVYDEDWTELGRVPASESRDRNQPSHLEVSPDGEFVYVANRGPDTITVLTADQHLTRVAEVPCGGAWPRHFAIDGELMYVACQHSAGVSTLAFRRGVPQFTGEVFNVETPSCVLTGF